MHEILRVYVSSIRMISVLDPSLQTRYVLMIWRRIIVVNENILLFLVTHFLKEREYTYVNFDIL